MSCFSRIKFNNVVFILLILVLCGLVYNRYFIQNVAHINNLDSNNEVKQDSIKTYDTGVNVKVSMDIDDVNINEEQKEGDGTKEKSEEIQEVENEEKDEDDNADGDPMFDVDPKFRKLKYFLLFIGYSRSGTSLTATLLDAHKHVIVSHEFAILYSLDEELLSRDTVFKMLYRSSQTASNYGHRSKNGRFGIYNYFIPNTHQGTYEDHIEVIGDKEAETTTYAFYRMPSEKFENLRSIVKKPIKFIHVIRNPFDMIATKTLKKSGYRKNEGDVPEQVDESKILGRAVTEMVHLIDIVSKVKKEHGDMIHDLYYSDLVKDTKTTLLKVCQFLEINCDDDYLTACQNKMMSVETFTRQYIVWPDKYKQVIEDKIRTTDYLQGRFQFELD